MRIILFSLSFFFMLTISAFHGSLLYAESSSSFGLAGAYGYSMSYKKRGNFKLQNAPLYGGGLVLERMYNDNIGIHSGVWFFQTVMDISMEDSSSSTDITGKATMRVVQLPINIVLGVNSSSVSFCLLFGGTIAHITSAKMQFEDSATGDNIEANTLRYVNYLQAGPSGGVLFKFRIGTYTEFYIGAMGEYYLTKFLKSDSDSYLNIYSVRGVAGLLFRTTLFPSWKKDTPGK